MTRIFLVLTLALGLAACKSAEERAAEHFETAQELLAQGDESRALVELRNALLRDPTLRDARLMFAEILMEQGRTRDAFGQYVQIIESIPQDLEANRALATLAFESGAWEEAAKYAGTITSIDDQDVPALAILAALDYRKAVLDNDLARQADATRRATALIAQDPTLLSVHRILITSALRDNRPNDSLDQAELGLEHHPQDRDLNLAKLQSLNLLGMGPEVETQLLHMTTLFPEDQDVQRMLMDFYVRAGRIDDALSWLRGRIDPDSDIADNRLIYLRILGEAKSSQVMLAELTDMLNQTPLPTDIEANLLDFIMIKTGASFAHGDQDAAMAELEQSIDGMEPSEDVNQIRVQLARMRDAVGNNVGARALIEQVLDHDAGQVEALKMRSLWLISDDKTAEAIRNLREALANSPNDSETVSLLASAYRREGRIELMAEMLSRAVEMSNRGPNETLRYTAYLNEQQEYVSSESLLLDSLRQNPSNLQLLVALTRVHLAMEDIGRVQQDIDAIRQGFPGAEGEAVANELQAQLLSQTQQTDALSAFLQSLAGQSEGQYNAEIAIIRDLIRNGQLPDATDRAMQLAQTYPDEPAVLLLRAQIIRANGDQETGVAQIRDVTATHPEFEGGWGALYAALRQNNDLPGATDVLTQARAALPDSRALALMQAGLHEETEDFDAAIALYEMLYERNGDDLLVTNNLASLLSTSRSDPASLDRAWLLARRLRGSQVPALLDTFGWIALQRGEVNDALEALDIAAAALPEEPVVWYHLGRALAADSQKTAAAQAYETAQNLLEQGARAYPELGQELEQAVADLAR
ncbi:tetratricopeptide repeat protein [Aestuariibius sp. HNIBRBA575]|uniref:tetratricopeptide repeat protein n=1 Tax=Aestuariibius sp. HNIBRBA575 TaxID=3233343 RepID=UPI0034A5AB25